MQSSLLSPAESHAFQSFLSTMDYPDDTLTASEWAIYNSGAPLYGTDDDPLDDTGGSVNPARREALAKATKDLMSLDPDGWNGGSAIMEGGGQSQAYDSRGQYSLQPQQHQPQQNHHQFAQRQQTMQHLHEQHQHQQQHPSRQHSFSSGADLFPFLHNKVSSSHELRYPMQRHHQLPHLGPSPMTPSNSDHGSPTSPQSPFGFQQQQHDVRSIIQQHHLPHPHQVNIPTHPERQQRQQRGLSPTSSLPARSTKRSSVTRPSHQSDASNNMGSTSTNGGRSNGTTNGIHAATTTKRQRSSTSPSTAANAPPPSTQHQGQTGTAAKPTLLSPSQKKANHIQSEQKRRANIRRGYEALCETVPALREAIREEEEAERQAALAGGGRGGSAAQRKKSRGRKGAKDGEEKDAKERLDGRAGPRSENVVLSKTIEHIQMLIANRSALLARLHRARSSLPPGHPALLPLVPDPPWEREWKGGSGRLEEDDDDEGGSEGEGEEGE